MRTTVTINQAGTYLRITDYSPEFVNVVINPFCRRFLSSTKKEPVPGTRFSRTVIDKVFARFNHDKTELRISAGLLDEFRRFMGQVGYNESRIKLVKEPKINAKKVDFEWNPGWGELRENQKEICAYQLAEGGIKINDSPTGFG